MVHPQRTCSHMELLPLVCLCLLSCSGTTSADPAGRVVVKEGRDVILPCFFNGVDIEQELLEWKKNGQTVLKYDAGFDRSNPTLLDDRFSHFKEELKLGNASLKIRNTRVADSGNYTCDTPRVESSKTVHVKLVCGW
ncbi:CD276 antigen-like [Larimichthys crocea]|uniref:CD276 antigen-like n=1 Tax=Larimichthys crocea TaxID=215358 RepID=UPI000F5D590F|nr:CD276 antigen-like [Larimichthys crocea]